MGTRYAARLNLLKKRWKTGVPGVSSSNFYGRFKCCAYLWTPPVLIKRRYMTSEERREGRYQRRQIRRRNRAQQYQKTFEEIFTYENMLEAGKKCCNGSRWKASVINFESNLVVEVAEIRRKLFKGERTFKRFNSFTTWEHGKERQINALHIRDRVIQKCLCREFLVPAISKSFIYDNGACLPGKGKHFQVKRLRKHLTEHYRKHGLEGGILQFDFKGYFSSIPHERLKGVLRKLIDDDRVYALVCDLIDDFQKLSTCDPKDKVKRGIGLGSEISQVLGLLYCSSLDHYFKDRLGIKGYGRYNDDGYIIHESLGYLEELKDVLFKLADELNVVLSPKKVKITPFKHHGFSFLKVRTLISPEGHISMRLNRRSLKVQRRKLKVFRRWLDDGKLAFEDIAASYQSWRAYARETDSYDTLRSMDAHFIRLYEDELRQRDRRFPCFYPSRKTKYGWEYDLSVD